MVSRSKAIALILSALALSAGASAQEVGSRAPGFDLVGTPKQVRLADMKGQVVYVDFWASWCAPCKQSFPWMNEMQAKYGPRGFNVVGINVDQKREDAEKFLAGTPAKFAVAYDTNGKVAEVYQPKGMPTSFLIGADGKVRAVHIGFKDSNRDELEREIQSALTAARK
ncbi:MAG TPA: TlpA disulfide reductase family protein [Burkholderiaceae bacterium]|jgi:thiol-disulfide isomerase/thioredoxin|nr:TlpA disulfide reductase family protein [Burkholderiaceae bacterium]